MNKLELLYKMAGAMKTKEQINGAVKLVATEGNKEFAVISNNFKKNCVSKDMSVDVKASFDNGEIKIDKDIKKDFNMEELHQKHHEMHKDHHKGNCHGKRKGGNKFAKLEMMFKVLKDLDVKEENGLNVLELDIKDCIEKKKAKIAEFKANHPDHCHEHKHEGMENCELMDIFKIKHAMFKEMMSTDFDKATLKIVLADDCSIKEVKMNLVGAKSFALEAALNY
ncbi:MAG: hypothetical protein ACRDD2_10800 [Sarcina sp.]